MDIRPNINNSPIINFGDLACGDCYRVEGSSIICMKMGEASTFSSVVLRSGAPLTHGDSRPVQRVYGAFVESVV